MKKSLALMETNLEWSWTGKLPVMETAPLIGLLAGGGMMVGGARCCTRTWEPGNNQTTSNIEALLMTNVVGVAANDLQQAYQAQI